MNLRKLLNSVLTIAAILLGLIIFTPSILWISVSLFNAVAHLVSKDFDDNQRNPKVIGQVIDQALIDARFCNSVPECNKLEMSYFEREAPVHYYTTYGLNSEEKYRKVAAYIKENFHGEGVAFCFYIKPHSYYVDVPLFEWRSREPDYCQGEGY
jgi:hypothetical protein